MAERKTPVGYWTSSDAYFFAKSEGSLSTLERTVEFMEVLSKSILAGKCLLLTRFKVRNNNYSNKSKCS